MNATPINTPSSRSHQASPNARSPPRPIESLRRSGNSSQAPSTKLESVHKVRSPSARAPIHFNVNAAQMAHTSPPSRSYPDILDSGSQTSTHAEIHHHHRPGAAPTLRHTFSDKHQGSNHSDSDFIGKRIKLESSRSSSADYFKTPYNTSGTSTPGLPPSHQTSSSQVLSPLLPLSPFSPVPPTSRPIKVETSEESRTEDDRTLSIDLPVSKPQQEDEAEDYEDRFHEFGFDQGRTDLDYPRNDDANALIPYSPNTLRQVDSDRFPSPSYAGSTNGFGFGLQPKSTRIDTQGYYAQAVPIRIPSSLLPLPELLRDNPMNLLYFHHFLNHTARILVPHDCADNPFRRILPQRTWVIGQFTKGS